MKKRVIRTMLAAVFACISASYAQTITSGENFESYSTGSWTASSAPEANPAAWQNGEGSAIQPFIVDMDGTNQELQLEINLLNMWQVGFTYEIACTNNVSQDIDDYTLDFYLRIPPDSVTNLATSTLILNIRNPDDLTRGSMYNIASNDVGFAISQEGGILSIPLATENLATGASHPMDGSAAKWQVEFRIDSDHSTSDLPILIAVDDMVVHYTEPPFLNTTVSPTGITNSSPTIAATVYDGTSEVDTMLLYLDGDLVASNSYAGGSTTNTITYNAVDLDWGTYSATVIATDALLYSETNSWSFMVAAAAPEPSTDVFEVYNFNFAGSTLTNDGVDVYWYPVPDGTVAAAPSIGSNIWCNVDYNNPWYMLYQPATASGASGGDSPTVEYVLMDTSKNFELQIPWTWMEGWHDRPVFAASARDTIWSTALAKEPFDVDLEFRGFDPLKTCDVYLYYTNPDTADTTSTTYTITIGNAPVPSATLESSHAAISQGGYTNYMEGTNYVVITGVIPRADGVIGVNAAGDTGGLSAVQIAVRNDGIQVRPNIQSFVMTTNGTAEISWDSELFIKYKVMSSPDLTGSSWTEVTNGIEGVDGALTSAVPVSVSQEFFRIETE